MALSDGTVTFLFTDVEGSTRQLERTPEEFTAALDASAETIRAACRDGREVDTQGDSFFFAFTRADAAVAAAQAAQERLAALPIRVRMGIHTGDVRRSGERYVGLEVNRAARIAAAAHGGQVLLSQATRDLVPSADVVDLGEHRLKDLSLPSRLFQLGHEVFPPPLTLENRPMNLPAQPWPLVGRDRELAELRRLVVEGSARAITVTGPAGAGKTRLALQVAADAIDDFPGGVWYVALESVRDAARVPAAVATTLGVAEADLTRELEAKQPLLVLDNLEQLLSVGPSLATLVREHGATILATSRAPLRVSGEQEYPLGSLETGPAVELFVERAQAVRPDFADRDGTLTELVQRLDGLPLAIELAAARTRLLAPEEILHRLDDRFSLLTGGPRDRPQRQQTLVNAIEWSYDLLGQDEQGLFASLSCFRGGFDLEAAERVCDATLDRLETLVEDSLLRVEERRFSMLESIREYAASRLEASGRQDEVQRRHAEYYLELGEQARVQTTGGCDLAKWAPWCRLEADNLRATIATLDRAGEPEQLAKATVALASYLQSRALLVEARELLQRLVPHLAELDDQLRADVDRVRAEVLWLGGDAAGCRAVAEDLLHRAHRLGSKRLEASALNDLGLAALRDGDCDLAESWFDRYEELVRADLPERVPFSVNNRAMVALLRGHPAEARSLLQQQLDAGAMGEGLFEHNIGLTHLAERHPAVAIEWFARSLQEAGRARRDGIFVYGLHGLAAAHAEDDPALGARLRGCALALARRFGLEMEEPDAGFARATDRVLREELGPEYTDLLAEGGALAPETLVQAAVTRPESAEAREPLAQFPGLDGH